MTESVPFFAVRNLSKKVSAFALKEVSFRLDEGDYFILLGVSGAGKSMVLETIAGLIHPDSGNIFLNGREITNEKIQKRGVGIVFQDHAIFPHMTVSENIAYPLKGKSMSRHEKQSTIRRIAEQLDIAPLLNRRPGSLSGGELQRVALARVLVQKPDILLLDEPLSSIDTRLKADLRALLRQLNRQGQTIIHVTHDYEEALSLGNSIAIMHDGMVLQSGKPMEVFSRPASEFVAYFTGVRNFFKVQVSDDGESVLLENQTRFMLSPAVEEKNGYVLIRSEDIFLSKTAVDTSAVNNFRGKVREVIPTRNGYEVVCHIGFDIISVISHHSLEQMDVKEGDDIYIHFKATAIRFIPS